MADIIRNEWPESIGTGGRLRPEQVADFRRNEWPTSPEYAGCPLYPFRMPKGKQNPNKRDKAIRAYCLWCMNGQRNEIKLCPSDDCSLFEYRLTSVKKSHIGQTSRRKNLTGGGSSLGGAYG